MTALLNISTILFRSVTISSSSTKAMSLFVRAPFSDKYGLINVKYCNFHSHAISQWHLKMNPEIRNEIEIKLRMGIDEKTTLTQIKI